MKSEYGGDPKISLLHDPSNMFSKTHLHPNPFSNHFHLGDRQQASDDEVATSRTTVPALPTDGASIEAPRRKRGRPSGSKNKPKLLQQLVVTRELPELPSMGPYILEVAAGNDVVEAVSRFCHRKGTGLCILTGSGTVANFTLRQPVVSALAPTVTFHGRFDILSISATFLPNNAQPYPVPNGFSISLAAPQGQVLGGAVVGPLITAGPVFMVAASLNNHSYHRLPENDHEEDHPCWKSGSESQSPPGSGGGDSGNTPAQEPESVGMSMYSSHMGSSDVIWAPPPAAGSRHY